MGKLNEDLTIWCFSNTTLAVRAWLGFWYVISHPALSLLIVNCTSFYSCPCHTICREHRQLRLTDYPKRLNNISNHSHTDGNVNDSCCIKFQLSCSAEQVLVGCRCGRSKVSGDVQESKHECEEDKSCLIGAMVSNTY